MKTFTTVVVISCFSLLASHAVAQNRAIAAQDVVGNWTLQTTPIEGGSVTISMDNGEEGDLTLPLTVTRSGSALSCNLDNSSTRCEIRNGRLVITARQSDATMIFNLSSRAQNGFSGETRIRLPVLPVGSMKIGTLRMTRR